MFYAVSFSWSCASPLSIHHFQSYLIAWVKFQKTRGTSHHLPLMCNCQALQSSVFVLSIPWMVYYLSILCYVWGIRLSSFSRVNPVKTKTHKNTIVFSWNHPNTSPKQDSLAWFSRQKHKKVNKVCVYIHSIFPIFRYIS